MTGKGKLLVYLFAPLLAVGTMLAGLKAKSVAKAKKKRPATKIAKFIGIGAKKTGQSLFTAGRAAERARIATFGRLPFAHR